MLYAAEYQHTRRFLCVKEARSLALLPKISSHFVTSRNQMQHKKHDDGGRSPMPYFSTHRFFPGTSAWWLHCTPSEGLIKVSHARTYSVNCEILPPLAS